MPGSSFDGPGPPGLATADAAVGRPVGTARPALALGRPRATVTPGANRPGRGLQGGGPFGQDEFVRIGPSATVAAPLLAWPRRRGRAPSPLQHTPTDRRTRGLSHETLDG